MRLGNRLTVETAERNEKRLNMLRIDWSAFGDLDAMLDEIDIVPERGGSKPECELERHTPYHRQSRCRLDL